MLPSAQCFLSYRLCVTIEGFSGMLFLSWLGGTTSSRNCSIYSYLGRYVLSYWMERSANETHLSIKCKWNRLRKAFHNESNDAFLVSKLVPPWNQRCYRSARYCISWQLCVVLPIHRCFKWTILTNDRLLVVDHATTCKINDSCGGPCAFVKNHRLLAGDQAVSWKTRDSSKWPVRYRELLMIPWIGPCAFVKS